MSALTHTARHWIDGQWCEIGPETPSIDPATGAQIGSYLDGGEAAAQLAIDAAGNAARITDIARNGTQQCAS